MFVLAKRNVVIPSPDGSTAVRVRRGDLVTLPDWAVETAYCRALIADGKLMPSGKSDKETQAAAEKPVKTRRGPKTTEE